MTIDWSLLGEIHTLPEMVEEIPLPDDFRSYSYQVDIEFPEFEDLDETTSAKVRATGEVLPDYPHTTTEISISAHKGFLNVRFIPVVYRNGRYQRINTFKLSLTSTLKTEVSRAQPTRSEFTANSILANGNIVKIRVGDTGVYQITHNELRRMGFANPDKVRVYGYGGYLLSNSFQQHPCDDLPEVPAYRANNALLFFARGTVNWNWNSNAFFRIRNCYSDDAFYFLTEDEETPMTFALDDTALDTNASHISVFNEYKLYEVDAYSWSKSGRELYDNYDYVNGNIQTYNFSLPGITKIGRASCRERVCQYVEIQALAGSLK